MDFRKCPACEASVLEDDVDDCPFCGASMSGKPKPTGSSSKPTTASKESGGKAEQAKKPASGGPAPKPGGAGKAQAKASDDDKAGEDDPFDVDTTAVRKARTR